MIDKDQTAAINMGFITRAKRSPEAKPQASVLHLAKHRHYNGSSITAS